MTNTEPTTAPILVMDQGSFAAGGTVVTGPDGQTLHGDHAAVKYQLPPDPRPLSIVFQHGHLQFSKTWESTPDGREGFDTIFLRRGYGVFLVDQPRRGRGGHSTVPGQIEAMPDDHSWFNTFRVGIWPDFFPGVQFDRSPETLNQYFRQSTPNTGPFDLDVVSDALAAVCERTGPAILVTHSMGGGVGWFARQKTDTIRAIVSYEPGSNFPFPEGEVPAPMDSAAGPLVPVAVPLEDFRKLTRIPIVIYYGDYIPSEPSTNPGQDQWRVRLDMARLWADSVNRHGGQARVVHLPEIGITGNTHFPFSDLNNVQIADLMEEFLTEHGLTGAAS